MMKLLTNIPMGVLSFLATVLCCYFSLDAKPIGAEELTLFEGADKVVHGLMYFLITCAYILDYTKYRMPHHSRINVELALAATAIMLGGVMEVLQLEMNLGRGFEALDWVADAVGAALGFAFMHWWFIHYYRSYALSTNRYYRLQRRRKRNRKRREDYKHHHHHHSHSSSTTV